MLVPRHVLQSPEPDVSGTGVAPAAPPVEAPAPAPVADAPAPAAPAAAPAAPEDKFAGLNDALAAVSAPAAPAQPRVAGKFAASSQVIAGVAAPAAPAVAPAAPTPAPKPGEVDLTPPEDMNERTAGRWGQLTERAKLVPVLEQRATQAETGLNSVRRMVSDSGMQPQEFTEMLEMNRLARSQNPQDAQRALQMLDAQRAQLATRLGIDAPGVDVLAAHPDIKADVDNLLMTKERALEIVRLRNGEQQTQRTTQEAQRQQQEHSQFVQTVNTAAANMERTLAGRAGTPGHDAKVQYIRSHFANPENLQRFVGTYQPQQWESVLLTMYEAFSPQAAAPAPPAVPQPLRPGITRTGAQVASGPVTAETAVMGAFDRLGL